MSYRHITLTKVASSKSEIIRYEITSPDFNDEFQQEHFGIIEIDTREKEFTHYPSVNWIKNRIYPIDLFKLSPKKRAILSQGKYSGYASGAWPLAIFEFIKKGFQSGEWKDEVRLFA